MCSDRDRARCSWKCDVLRCLLSTRPGASPVLSTRGRTASSANSRPCWVTVGQTLHFEVVAGRDSCREMLRSAVPTRRPAIADEPLLNRPPAFSFGSNRELPQQCAALPIPHTVLRTPVSRVQATKAIGRARVRRACALDSAAIVFPSNLSAATVPRGYAVSLPYQSWSSGGSVVQLHCPNRACGCASRCQSMSMLASQSA